MDLLVKFEAPHTYWNPLIVFQNYFNWLKQNNSQNNIVYQNLDPLERGNPSGLSSPHIMTIRNLDSRKYLIVSYWDRAIELTWEYNGWDSENMVEIITSAGVHVPMNFTPFSYTCYNWDFEEYSEKNRKPWSEKENNTLLFRGYLYADRKSMKSYKPEFFSEDRKNQFDYFDELNNSKISLSLNGAGEICNRDMEILSCGSVLLRPELSQKFYNELIPDFHYVSVPKVSNPIEQLDLLLKKYEDIKDNHEFLNNISRNGLEWYLNNGTMNANVELLKKIINLESLN